ncbi:DNA mismatch repair protein [Mucilaginibacter sp. UC70_90]
MSFITDQQTMDDLNLFGKNGAGSIYQIFNKTRTRGGAAALDEMFRYPLSDHGQINDRSETIQFFARSAKAFPFAADQFDAVESYLQNTDQRTRLSAQDGSISKRLSNLVAMDIDTSLIYQGIIALIKLLKDLHIFMSGLELEPQHFYQSKKNEVLDIMSASVFAEALKTRSDAKLSPSAYAEFDELFRFQYRESVLKLLTYIYSLDVYFTVAKVAAENGYIFPKALPKEHHVLKLDGVYHPQVKDAVANTIEISADSNVIFLTGANMAGKSTLMKSLSIALFLAHMGFPVTAKEMEFSVLDGMYTTINLPDNLGMGASHFYVEVLRVKKIALSLRQGRNLFVLFDEMFRGTNVKDACEATIAFTQAFAAKRNSLFMISTHIIEAGEVLMKKCANIKFVYLPTLMHGNKPAYTYTLKQGLTADRHGMLIIENEGVLDILKSGIERMSKRGI